MNSLPDVSCVGRPTYAFDDSDLTLLDDQHGHFFHAHQERVEVVRAVQQGIVLEPDLAAQVQELLKVLIGAVLVVLVAQNGLDESRVSRGLAPAAVSSASISLNPPRRLAMSPAGKGSPSNVVTIPIMSRTLPASVGCGEIRVTSSCRSSSPNAS